MWSFDKKSAVDFENVFLGSAVGNKFPTVTHPSTPLGPI